MMKLSSALLVVAISLPVSASAASWEIDPVHSNVGFAVRHMVVSTVRGEFGKISGTVVYDEKDAAKSSVDVSIDVSSITTRNEQRDGHLKGPDFFDVQKFPTMTFKSTKVEKLGKGKLKVQGDLTLHGATKSVVLEVTGPTAEVKGPMGKFIMGASAEGKLNRKDFGVSFNKVLEGGGLMVGDEVSITIDLELDKKDAT